MMEHLFSRMSWRMVVVLFGDLMTLAAALFMFPVKWIWPQDLDTWTMIAHMHVENKPPLLLIHGSGSKDMQWLPVAFQARHRWSVYTVQLDTSLDSMDEMIQPLVDKLRHIAPKHENHKITILGHSLGGICAAYALEKHQSLCPNVKKLITVACPWKGSPLIPLLGLSNRDSHDHVHYKRLTPNSMFLNQLAANWVPLKIPLVCVGSEYDLLVPFDFCYPSWKLLPCLIHHVVAGHYSIIWFVNSILSY